MKIEQIQQIQAVVNKVRDPEFQERAPPVTDADWHSLFAAKEQVIMARNKDVAFLQGLLKERDACILALDDQLTEALEEIEALRKEEPDDVAADAVSAEPEHGGKPRGRRGANGRDEKAASDQGTQKVSRSP